ncbi:unnamed protein product [Paramecium sonneborni]|uniref:Uncharacterized protein n=1 Tax=Paramecium sonneborni TaxID=65129 RepID=A0A8S1R7W9_9CILI|nr:unnamed protein product [Paramecium sonneborni]
MQGIIVYIFQTPSTYVQLAQFKLQHDCCTHELKGPSQKQAFEKDKH